MKVHLFTITIGLAWLISSCGNSKNANENDLPSVDIFTLHPSNYQSDFTAIAKDSTWKLSIIFNKIVVFTSKTENIVFNAQDAVPNVAAGADVISIHSENKKGILNIEIDVASCREGNKKIAINYKDKEGSTNLSLNGCGEYTGQAELFSLWTLTHIDNKEIDRSIFRREPPFFQFNVEDGKVGGSGGCNTFGASVRFEYNALFMDALIATRMYCEVESEIENKVFDRVSEVKVIYTITDEQLFLESTKGSLTFRKAD